MNIIRGIAIFLLGSTSCQALALQDVGAPGPSAGPPEAAKSAGIADIVVTAQKRSESVNKVGMSITAASGDTLMKQGITQTADLAKISVGFNFAQTQFATPVYSIRGVGFYETSLAATPAVTVYTDEVALPYPQMTRFSGFDIERVEILKGPQGTLFGQNATGGAVNYIAAKPTTTFKAGVDGSFGRFNSGEASGYVSGPLTDTLSARLAVKTIQGDDWQRSYTRNDKRGQKDVLQGRFTLRWKPTDRLTSELTLSGWRDKSDTTAYQLVNHDAPLPALSAPGFLTYPLAPHNDRDADWTPGERTARNDSFYQIAWRNDFSISEDVTLTAISAYSHIKIDAPIDSDGTSLPIYQLLQTGHTSSFSQEVRLAGNFGSGGHWIVGGNYGHDSTLQRDFVHDPASVVSRAFGPQYSADNYIFYNTDKARSLAAFGNVEIPLLPRLSAQGGVRYTNLHRQFAGCTSSAYDDNPTTGTSAALENFLNTLRQTIGEAPITISPGSCFSYNPATFTPELVHQHLNEHNVSWRAALNYKPDSQTLLYANISKGYKAGTFANIGATVSTQFEPAKQEALLAYEAGFKASLLQNHLQLSGAGFYYDYSDKQLRGSVIDPILGSLGKLVNVPKSHVVGGELQATARPFTGLRLTSGITYIKTQVDHHYLNYTPYGDPDDFGGQSFPYTPKWQANGDAEYTLPVTDTLSTFLGASAQYQGKTTTAFGNLPAFYIKAYTLIDLRLGIQARDDKWRASIWGKNVTNRYYRTSVSFVPTADTVASAGMPATYGISGSYRF